MKTNRMSGGKEWIIAEEFQNDFGINLITLMFAEKDNLLAYGDL